MAYYLHVSLALKPYHSRVPLNLKTAMVATISNNPTGQRAITTRTSPIGNGGEGRPPVQNRYHGLIHNHHVSLL